jgi:hypothetical protein
MGETDNLLRLVSSKSLLLGLYFFVLKQCFIGDSGGPMVNQRGEITGLTGFGKRAALGRMPLTYTRVPIYGEWIQNIVTNKESLKGRGIWSGAGRMGGMMGGMLGGGGAGIFGGRRGRMARMMGGQHPMMGGQQSMMGGPIMGIGMPGMF